MVVITIYISSRGIAAFGLTVHIVGDCSDIGHIHLAVAVDIAQQDDN